MFFLLLCFFGVLKLCVLSRFNKSILLILMFFMLFMLFVVFFFDSPFWFRRSISRGAHGQRAVAGACTVHHHVVGRGHSLFFAGACDVYLGFVGIFLLFHR